MSRTRRRTRTYTPSRGVLKGKRFQSTREYRKALSRLRKPKSIRTLADLDKLSTMQREKRADAIEILGRMRREGVSLSRATRLYRSENPDSRITPRGIVKYAGSALYKKKGNPRGRWLPKKSDRILRIMMFPIGGEMRLIEVRDSRTASEIGRYHNAVKVYLNTGDASGLKEFRGRQIRVGKSEVKFVTGPKALERLAEFGYTDLDSIYERSGQGR